MHYTNHKTLISMWTLNMYFKKSIIQSAMSRRINLSRFLIVFLFLFLTFHFDFFENTFIFWNVSFLFGFILVSRIFFVFHNFMFCCLLFVVLTFLALSDFFIFFFFWCDLHFRASKAAFRLRLGASLPAALIKPQGKHQICFTATPAELRSASWCWDLKHFSPNQWVWLKLGFLFQQFSIVFKNPHTPDSEESLSVSSSVAALNQASCCLSSLITGAEISRTWTGAPKIPIPWWITVHGAEISL